MIRNKKKRWIITRQRNRDENRDWRKIEKAQPAQSNLADTPKDRRMPITEPTAFTITTFNNYCCFFLFFFLFILPKSILFSGLEINNKKNIMYRTEMDLLTQKRKPCVMLVCMCLPLYFTCLWSKAAHVKRIQRMTWFICVLFCFRHITNTSDFETIKCKLRSNILATRSLRWIQMKKICPLIKFQFRE